MTAEDIQALAFLLGEKYGWQMHQEEFDTACRTVLSQSEHGKFNTRLWANYLLLRAGRLDKT